MIRFGELNISVRSNVHSVTPRIQRIQRIQETDIEQLDTHFLKGLPNEFLIVDDDTKMPFRIRCLLTPFRKVYKLIIELDKDRSIVATVDLKVQEAAVER